MNHLRKRLDDHEHQSSELVRVIADLRDVADARRAIGIGVKFLLWVSGIALAIISIHDLILRLRIGA